MYFTLCEAMTAKYLLELNKNGNKYVVLLWDKATKDIKEMYRFTTKIYHEAMGVFNLYAERYNLSHLVKDVDNSDVYAYIDSQYD